MRMAQYWILATVVALSFCLMTGCGEDRRVITEPDQAQQSDHFVSIGLGEPMTIRTLEPIVRANDLAVEELRLEFDGFTCGYTVAGRTLEEVEGDFYRQHIAFLVEMQDQPDSLIAPLTRPGIIELLGDAGKRSTSISAVTFRGEEVSNEVMSKLKAKPRDDIVVMPLDRSLEELNAESEPGNPFPQSLWHERWAPYAGTSEVPRTFTRQYFKFNSVWDFQGDTKTYEHETQIYDRNYANYGGYWATNMPYGYKDTQFGDTMDNFTVGTYRANLLYTYTWYWTYMSLSQQSAPSAVCRIRGQIGHRSPSWCYSTWCVWADATTWPGQLAYITVPNNGYPWQY